MPQSKWGRDLLLALLAIPSVVAAGALSSDDASWFPQDRAHDFYVVKGLLATLAVILILVHMASTWRHITNTGQRLRYLALLVLVTAVASGSTEQLATNVPVSGRNIVGCLGAVLVIVAMVVSIRDDRRTYR